MPAPIADPVQSGPVQTGSTQRDPQPLGEQMQALMARVRALPSEPKLRIHLAQLALVLGQWERALTQLQAVAMIDAAALPFAQTYREAIRCERLRERVFAGQLAPPSLGQPPHWFALLAQALAQRAAGQHAAADALQAEAFDAAETTGFAIDGQPVDWLADGDSRLGPICELVLGGNYYWIPFGDIQSLEIEPPADLRDLVWIPARLTLRNGGQHPVLIPSRYPGSAESGDDGLALSRLTRWDALSDSAWAGLGQRMWVSDRGEHPLLEIRELRRIDPAAADHVDADRHG
jgi:type VI secretion system protein ImpE